MGEGQRRGMRCLSKITYCQAWQGRPGKVYLLLSNDPNTQTKHTFFFIPRLGELYRMAIECCYVGSKRIGWGGRRHRFCLPKWNVVSETESQVPIGPPVELEPMFLLWPE